MEQPEREQHRKTSIDAYRKIRDGGLLTQARWEVYAAVHYLGDHPPTSHEIDKHLDRRLQHTRLTELREMGVIEEGPVRECTVTKQNVLTWVVTGQLPKGLPKRPKQPSRVELTMAILTLEASNPHLPNVIEWLTYKRDMSK